MNGCLMLALPSHANKVRRLIVMSIKLALIGIENGMSDPPRQVNIGRPDGNLALGIIHAHYPLEGMFYRLLLGLIHGSSPPRHSSDLPSAASVFASA